MPRTKLVRTVRVGTRGSQLARIQTAQAVVTLKDAWHDVAFEIVEITTHGDRTPDAPLPSIGGKGVFTAELETALREGTIDIAVHSLKDLPVEQPDGILLGAITARADVRDALISRGSQTLLKLPKGSVVGTSSLRRAGQLRHFRRDLRVIDLRGNVDTRLKKALASDGPYDAIVLAAAGLERLDLSGQVTELLELEVMLPAPGQGALAIQCRDEWLNKRMLTPLVDVAATIETTAERAFLQALGGGCAVPVAALGRVTGRRLFLRGRVIALDATRTIDVGGEDLVTVSGARRLGQRLADQALAAGADELLSVGAVTTPG